MILRNAQRNLSDPYNLAKLSISLALAYLFIFIVLPAALSILRESHTIGSLDVTPTMQAKIVESLADHVTQRYFDADKAVKIAAALRQAQRNGEFNDISSPSQFALLLTSYLALSSNDQHIQVIFRPDEVADFEFHNFPPPRKEDQSAIGWFIDRLGRYQANFGVQKVTQSDAGIGYLKLDGFFRPYLSAEKFAAAMDRLADSKALIIDLRNNRGGNRDSVALLASYFFDKPTHLSDVVAARTGERLHMWTSKDIEGSRYGETRPVYILTSHDTFSAGEDFAYAMQKLNRATIVGEVTGGGAHPIAPARLNAHFIALIPVAESMSAITHSNWEGVGVQPNIVADSRDALDIATNSILTRQLAKKDNSKLWLNIQK
jgi:hypothetical protein